MGNSIRARAWGNPGPFDLCAWLGLRLQPYDSPRMR